MRVTDLIIPPYVTLDDAQWQRLRQSAALDNIFPTLLPQAPEAIAIYYQETSMVFRYYPTINVVQFAAGSPGLDQKNANYLWEKSPAAPINDPQRLTVWDPPYADNLEQGLLITANTPVYFGDDYQGVVSIDLSIDATSRPTARDPTNPKQLRLYCGRNWPSGCRCRQWYSPPSQGDKWRRHRTPSGYLGCFSARFRKFQRGLCSDLPCCKAAKG